MPHATLEFLEAQRLQVFETLGHAAYLILLLFVEKLALLLLFQCFLHDSKVLVNDTLLFVKVNIARILLQQLRLFYSLNFVLEAVDKVGDSLTDALTTHGAGYSSGAGHGIVHTLHLI